MTTRAGWALALVVLGAGTAGCGATAHSAGKDPRASTTPAAFTSPGAGSLVTPPVSDRALTTGSTTGRIKATIVAFYRAAWQDNSAKACGLFSAAGRIGFMHAAAVSFPQSVNRYSTCEHAMQIYSATLTDSATTTQDNDPSFSGAALDDVGVQAITISGDRASAIAPTNVTELINPKRLDLVRAGDRWLIAGSHSLNASNLRQILARARAKGALPRKTK